VVSAKSVWVVGHIQTPNTWTPVLLHWDGSAWHKVYVPGTGELQNVAPDGRGGILVSRLLITPIVIGPDIVSDRSVDHAHRVRQRQQERPGERVHPDPWHHLGLGRRGTAHRSRRCFRRRNLPLQELNERGTGLGGRGGPLRLGELDPQTVVPEEQPRSMPGPATANAAQVGSPPDWR
jgi:hypothetical protein